MCKKVTPQWPDRSPVILTETWHWEFTRTNSYMDYGRARQRPLNAPHRGMSQKHANGRRATPGFKRVHWFLSQSDAFGGWLFCSTREKQCRDASSRLARNSRPYLFPDSVVKSTECSINGNSWGSCRTEYGRDAKSYKEKCQRSRCTQINDQVKRALRVCVDGVDFRGFARSRMHRTQASACFSCVVPLESLAPLLVLLL